MYKNIAIEETLMLAEQGDMEAQFNLGVAHYNGIEKEGGKGYTAIESNYNKALEWFTKAAEQGHADAQNNLGLLYRDGKETPEAVHMTIHDHEINDTTPSAQDYEEIFGDFGLDGPESLDYLDVAKALYEIKGVDKDKAVDWFIKAVASGSDAAQINLKNMFDS